MGVRLGEGVCVGHCGRVMSCEGCNSRWWASNLGDSRNEIY